LGVTPSAVLGKEGVDICIVVGSVLRKASCAGTGGQQRIILLHQRPCPMTWPRCAVDVSLQLPAVNPGRTARTGAL
jgi:hypothetical protein